MCDECAAEESAAHAFEEDFIMLKNIVFASKPEKEELDERLKAAKNKLSEQQIQITEHKNPVLVLV